MEQELNRKTMVIGHRNPDTDSICSAICYANLKQAVTGEEYMPARAGHVNGETQFAVAAPTKAEADEAYQKEKFSEAASL